MRLSIKIQDKGKAALIYLSLWYLFVFFSTVAIGTKVFLGLIIILGGFDYCLEVAFLYCLLIFLIFAVQVIINHVYLVKWVRFSFICLLESLLVVSILGGVASFFELSKDLL